MASANGQLKASTRRAKQGPPRTRHEKEQMKRQGNLYGWYAVLPVGRPKKKATVSDNDTGTKATGKRKDVPSTTTASTNKKTRTNWRLEENFAVLRQSVLSAIGSTTLTVSITENAVAVPYLTTTEICGSNVHMYSLP